MSQIKFRAWDKKSKKYRVVNSIAFHTHESVFDTFEPEFLNTPKLVNLWGRSIIEQKNIICHRENKEYVLERYTGLKDKDGEEIYENDILTVSGIGHCIVQWGCFSWNVYNNDSFTGFEDLIAEDENIERVKSFREATQDDIDLLGLDITELQ